MGHASPRAALIYQHATAERDRAVAEALSKLAAPTSAPKRTSTCICSTAKGLVPDRAARPGDGGGYAMDVRSGLSEAPGGTLTGT